MGNALIKALEQFSGAELWTEDVDAAWRDAIALMAGVMMDAANADDGPPVWEGTVVESTQVLQDLTVVRVQKGADALRDTLAQRGLLDAGPVATLSPIYPLSAGLPTAKLPMRKVSG